MKLIQTRRKLARWFSSDGWRNWSLGLVLVLAPVACEQSNTLPPLKVNIGQAFPQLSLRNLENQPLNFSVRPNSITVVNVWATWCPPCRHEMPSLQHLADILAQKDSNRFQVVGISVDTDPVLMREYLIDKKIHFANYRDVDMYSANQVLGIRVYPSTYIVGSDGKIIDIIEAWRYWDKPDMIDRLTAIGR